MNWSTEKVEKVEKSERRKPYESPKLLVYGNLAEMTRMRGRHGNPDGGKTTGKRHTGA
jgi:hypothetical protein